MDTSLFQSSYAPDQANIVTRVLLQQRYNQEQGAAQARQQQQQQFENQIALMKATQPGQTAANDLAEKQREFLMEQGYGAGSPPASQPPQSNQPTPADNLGIPRRALTDPPDQGQSAPSAFGGDIGGGFGQSQPDAMPSVPTGGGAPPSSPANTFAPQTSGQPFSPVAEVVRAYQDAVTRGAPPKFQKDLLEAIDVARQREAEAANLNATAAETRAKTGEIGGVNDFYGHVGDLPPSEQPGFVQQYDQQYGRNYQVPFARQPGFAGPTDPRYSLQGVNPPYEPDVSTAAKNYEAVQAGNKSAADVAHMPIADKMAMFGHQVTERGQDLDFKGKMAEIQAANARNAATIQGENDRAIAAATKGDHSTLSNQIVSMRAAMLQNQKETESYGKERIASLNRLQHFYNVQKMGKDADGNPLTDAAKSALHDSIATEENIFTGLSDSVTQSNQKAAFYQGELARLSGGQQSAPVSGLGRVAPAGPNAPPLPRLPDNNPPSPSNQYFTLANDPKLPPRTSDGQTEYAYKTADGQTYYMTAEVAAKANADSPSPSSPPGGANTGPTHQDIVNEMHRRGLAP